VNDIMVSDLQAYIISGIILLAVPIFAIAYFQSGFFWHWMRARGSRGKLVLIKVRGKLKDYFRTGSVEENFLLYKDATKEKKRVNIRMTAIYRCWGVPCIDVDEETNAIIDHDFTKVSGFDAIKIEDLYVRALMRPNLDDSKTLIIILLLCFIALFCIIEVYFGYKNSQWGAQNAEQLAFIVKTLSQNATRTGVIA
jgi:hypothetical protein